MKLKEKGRILSLVASVSASLLLLMAGLAGAQSRSPEDSLIIVGGDRSYPPYEFLDNDGKPAGFNVELTHAIAEVMGMNVEIRLGAWSEMRRAVESGVIHALQGISYSEQRAKVFDFTPPH